MADIGPKDQLDVALQQYETVRQESLGSMTHRTQIVSLGLATVGALVAGLLAFHGGKEPVTVWADIAVFAFAAPLVSLFALFMWLGEVRRMMRAGSFLWSLELVINEKFAKALGKASRPMGWESAYLRGIRDRQNQQMQYPYVVVFGTLILVAFVGIGVALAIARHNRNVAAHWTAVGLAGISFLSAAYAALEMFRILKLTKHDKCNKCGIEYAATEKGCPVCSQYQ